MTIHLQVEVECSSTLQSVNQIEDELISHILKSVNGVVILGDDDILIDTITISKKEDNK